MQKEGEEVVQVLEDIPLQPVEKTLVMQVDTLELVENSRGAGVTEHGHALKEAADCQTVRNLCWGRLLAGAVLCGEEPMQDE